VDPNLISTADSSSSIWASSSLVINQEHSTSTAGVSLPTLVSTQASTSMSTPASPAVPIDIEELKFRALRVITMTVKDSLLSHIMHIHDPRLVWIHLRDLYKSKSMNRRLTLK
jgi:hypothetical protein